MSFCIEDGYNTSYIDSLLIALFYKPTHLHELLTQLPENIKFTYLQELINTNFVEQVRKNYSINSGYINEIRNCSVICGWKVGSRLTEEYNVSEYLDFLLNGFGAYPITIETTSNESTTVTSIDLKFEEDSNIKNSLANWINALTNDQQYKFVELPPLIPICIDRKHEHIKIDIQKRIKFNKNNKNKLYENASWVIHSVICKSRAHYYCIVYTTYGDWYLFDNQKLPSILKINITDQDIQDKIKQECVVVLYRIDDILCDI